MSNVGLITLSGECWCRGVTAADCAPLMTRFHWFAEQTIVCLTYSETAVPRKDRVLDCVFMNNLVSVCN